MTALARAALALVPSLFAVAPAAAEPTPEARARLAWAPEGLGLAVDVEGELVGPVATRTLALTITNGGASVAEANLLLDLPEGAVVGRLALDVEGTWMEGEVMAAGAASRIYRDIVRPVGARRDPALLVALGAGAWSLSVFPVPAAGERHVLVTYHMLAAAEPGRVRVEAVPPTVAGGGRVFAGVPRFERPVDGPRPERVVVAVDTSLSMGDEGLAHARRTARAIAAAFPGTRLVSGDVTARACDGDIDKCLDELDIGGATDLEALLAAATRLAGDGQAAIVLVSDGVATAGAGPERLPALVAARVAAAPLALHTVPVVTAGRPGGEPLLRTLAFAGRGMSAADPLPALRLPRAPRYEVPGVADVDVVVVDGQVLVLGRVPAGADAIEVVRHDDRGPARARLPLERDDVARGFGVARLFGALAAARAGGEGGRVARAWGVARQGSAMLALERDDDYTSRGIARYKAVERALELGLAPPAVSAAAAASDRAISADSDSDGFDDSVDQCPTEPEVWNGFDDGDGCPDRTPPRVLILQEQIRIVEHVYFGVGSATPLPQALPLIDEVARVLADHPDLQLVAIEGHCDARERGADRLSQRRAEAVQTLLVARGVDAARLVAIGYGARMPLRPNERAEERAYNRRAGFRLVVRHDEVMTPLRPEEVAVVARATGRGVWVYELAIAEQALAAGQRPEAEAAFARAWEAAGDTASRLRLFKGRVREAFPDRMRAVVRELALAGYEVPHDEREPFYRELVKLLDEAPGADTPGLRAAAERWLATLAPSQTRWSAPPVWLELSADLLQRLGRPEEAARRRSELSERAVR